jgi:nucleoside phosphorylase
MTIESSNDSLAPPSTEQRRVLKAAFADLMDQETQFVRIAGAELRYALPDLSEGDRDRLIDSCVPRFLDRQPDADDYVFTLEGLLGTGDPRPAKILKATLDLLNRKWHAKGGRRTRSFLWSELRGKNDSPGAFKVAWHTLYAAGLSQSGRSPGMAAQDETDARFDFEFYLPGRKLEDFVKQQDVMAFRAYAAGAAKPSTPSRAGSAGALSPPAASGPATDHESIRPPCAVILTALPVEYAAVRRFLGDIEELTHAQGTVYERGWFRHGSRQWTVVIVEIGAGNTGAAIEAERAISAFTPEVAMFVGVAGGVKDVARGDVVAATKVYGYESGKDKNSGFEPRPDVGRTSYRLEKRSVAEARKDDWKALAPSAATSKVYVGPIAAGEKVVADKRSAIARFIKKQYGDSLAVEMEGHGFLQATHANHLDAVIVRGISDLLSGKAAADRAGAQKTASAHAAAFALHLLSRFEPPLSRAGTRPGDSTPGRQRDLATLNRLLPLIPTSTLDYFFHQAAVDLIPYQIFYFWEQFNAEVTAGHFQLFDSELRNRVQALHKGLAGALSFGGRFQTLPDEKTLRFVDARAGGSYDKWKADYDAYHRAVDEGQQAYEELLEYLKTAYPEIDLLEMTKRGLAARREYLREED